ncbi:extensin family protein [Aurantimonas sp. Leaf443]|uniref:extensin-like domain-containing protein n=1 Tax=Aurantimonas sp. Leaf443 TaxID=1736378 RepID=UPI0006F44383|nr:extensin family protein [Aurantimonas sp. Leaf443]KQT82148.1 hypothetical protein ASG48_15995 [Aurantimonas sp. Leaf443]
MRPLAAAMALLLLGAAPAGAQSPLPWPDANPLEGPARQAPEKRPRRAEPARERPAAVTGTVPAEAAVPVPQDKPAAPDASASPAPRPDTEGEAPDAPLPAESPAADVAVPAEAPATPAAPAAGVPAPDVPAPSPAPLDEGEAPVRAEGVPPLPEARPGSTAADPTPPAGPSPAPEPAAAPAATPAPADAAPARPAAPDLPDNSPEALKSRLPDVTPAASVAAAAAVEDAEACESELKRRGVTFTVEDSISEGECGVLRPVRVTRLSSGVAVSPATQMLCRAALALDAWMSEGVVPAARAEFPKETLTEFRHASTYVCRPRASENGISEHARGSAIDIAGFVFEGGRTIGVEAQSPGSAEERFQAAVRAAACGPFRTVLGPGTDADHDTHFHLDIAARKGGATYCR